MWLLIIANAWRICKRSWKEGDFYIRIIILNTLECQQWTNSTTFVIEREASFREREEENPLNRNWKMVKEAFNMEINSDACIKYSQDVHFLSLCVLEFRSSVTHIAFHSKNCWLGMAKLLHDTVLIGFRYVSVERPRQIVTQTVWAHTVKCCMTSTKNKLKKHEKSTDNDRTGTRKRKKNNETEKESGRYGRRVQLSRDGGVVGGGGNNIK